MKTNIAQHKRWWRFRPFTLVALAMGGAIVYTQFNAPADNTPGRMIYEADGQGRVRRVAEPSARTVVKTALPPLWKPEISFLLAHARKLHLTKGQHKMLRELDTAWEQENVSWQQQMRSATGDADALLQQADKNKGVSLSLIANSLSDYSRLSEGYDRSRASYWQHAISVLTADQRRQLDTLPRSAQPQKARL